MPFMELLASIANAAPGDDGAYRTQQRPPVIERYLEQARADRELLVLDIQPGRAGFDDEVDHLERYLREPDVGIGLDPEWHVGPGEVPGEVIGSVDARRHKSRRGTDVGGGEEVRPPAEAARSSIASRPT